MSSDADVPLQDHHFVKADEVDQTGADISPVSDEQLMEEVAEGLRGDQADSTSEELPKESKPLQQKRPALRREGTAPPPPLQPPPPAPVQQIPDRASDSLSLAQLRQLVGGLPKVTEQPAYAFEYSDTQSFPEELEEWFQYSEFDRDMLISTQKTFDQRWITFRNLESRGSEDLSWLTAGHELRKAFMDELVNDLDDHDLCARVEALEAICYIVTGVWALTAGKSVDGSAEDDHKPVDAYKSKSLQVRWIENNVALLQECSGIAALHKYFCRVFDKARTDSDDADSDVEDLTYAAAAEREVHLILTALYLTVEVGREQEKSGNNNTLIRDEVCKLDPNMLVLLVEVISRLRWDESANIPLTRVILLLWKLFLLCFGGSESLRRAKTDLEPFCEAERNGTPHRMPFLTASPLDYHAFRQEITSKYPAYNPPPPLLPVELENNSILPPLPYNPGKANSSSGLFAGIGPSAPGDNGSILHQSVHIATPAPSPPPSPIGPGGKTGKKQNYQTNQNFPFMYPPLDEGSNNTGGKGSSERQYALVGKKWEGSDVPTSIIEAGRLFSSHVKMTRATRQLWEERERFMKYDRGWNLQDSVNSFDDLYKDIEGLGLSEKENKSDANLSNPSAKESDNEDVQKPHDVGSNPPAKETDNEDIQKRLDSVETFYVRVSLHS